MHIPRHRDYKLAPLLLSNGVKSQIWYLSVKTYVCVLVRLYKRVSRKFPKESVQNVPAQHVMHIHCQQVHNLRIYRHLVRPDIWYSKVVVHILL